MSRAVCGLLKRAKYSMGSVPRDLGSSCTLMSPAWKSWQPSMMTEYITGFEDGFASSMFFVDTSLSVPSYSIVVFGTNCGMAW